MENDIINSIISNSSNFEAATSIKNLLDKAEYKSYSKILNRLEDYLQRKNINRDRSLRHDGIFIPITELDNYDIGINVELSNNMFFYCAVEKRKKRNASINTRTEFNNISDFLINNLNSDSPKINRTGWALAEKFIFTKEYEPDFRFSNNIDNFCKNLADQINKNIELSKIEEFIKT